MDYSVDAFYTFMDLDSAIYYAANSRFSNVRPVQARAKSVPGGANGLEPQAPRPKAGCVYTVEPVAPQRKPKACPLHTSLDQTSQNPSAFSSIYF